MITVRQFWSAWAVVSLALSWGLSQWFVDDATRLVAARRTSPEVAIPQPPPPEDPGAALGLLASSPMWGPIAAGAVQAAAAAASTPAPASAPRWFASGVYGIGPQRTLIVHHEGLARPSQQLRVGDRLPDRSVIQLIEADRVQVLTAPRRRGGTGELQWVSINRSANSPSR